VLAGTLPHLAQQNVFLGLPLVLLPEEVVLLVENGAPHPLCPPRAAHHAYAEIAVLVDDARAHLPPTEPQLSAHAAAENADIAQQTQHAEARLASESRAHGRATSDAAQRKRREREANRAAQAAAAGTEDAAAALLADVAEDAPPTAAYTAPHTVQIPASSSAHAWYDPGAVHDTLAAARAAGVWTYPADAAQRARCAAFRALWERDYFMGGGIKFGGDWLVYPGRSPLPQPWSG
jgi:tRNA-splicing endonuclease subunit Sen34